MSDTAPSPAAVARPPRPAPGVEVLGPMAGSGYRTPPWLVRRGDGQMVQLTPLLAAVLEAVDGERGPEAVADHVEAAQGRALHPDDVTHLTAKLVGLGLAVTGGGPDPAIRRADPLLGLRGRIQLAGPARTDAIARPFTWLFRPAVVAVVLAAFAAFSAWVVVRHGLGSAIDEAIADPMLLLGVIALVLASGAFHEVGHAAACRYGGAQPRAMGAAVYLVWPAFYTDVTESYRLDRRGRLRVDLGGLYFNAVFTVATGAAWALTGTEALLVLVPVQLLQMARQLVPIVRFDGYHILADLVGVPDLFARIRPTLARALPGRRVEGPNPLTRRAQAVVVTWVAVVVPFLLGSLGLLLWNLPSIVTSSLRSLGLQWDLFRDNVTAGRVAAATLGVVAMATVAFLPASAAYLTARIARRSGSRFWSATEGRPAMRTATLALVAVALVAATGPRLPSGPDAPTADLAGAVVDEGVTELAAGPASATDLRRTAPVPAPSPDPVVAEPEPAPAPAPAPEPEPVVRSVASEPAPAPAPVAVRTVRPAWPFSFPRPAPPGPGGNQAMAVGTVDGATQVALATSLHWLEGGPMANRNEAYAFAQCIDCRTVAVAFQIVAASGTVDTAVPQNIAVSANERCEACVTGAAAVQLAVTLTEQPPQAVKAQVKGIVERVNGLRGRLRTATLDEVLAELEAARAEALALLDPWIVDAEDQLEEEAADDAATADDDGAEAVSEALEPDTEAAEPVTPDAGADAEPAADDDAGVEPAAGPMDEDPEPVPTTSEPEAGAEDEVEPEPDPVQESDADPEPTEAVATEGSETADTGTEEVAEEPAPEEGTEEVTATTTDPSAEEA